MEIEKRMPEDKPADNEEEGKQEPEEKRNWRREAVMFIREFAMALIISLLLTRYVFIIPLVPTGSMIPTINIDERILVDKITRFFSPLKHGDIVVFPCPDSPEELYVKRIVAMAGDTLEIYGGEVYLNGVPLDEPFIAAPTEGIYGPYLVPEGHIFVMGDNRNHSRDSRKWVTTNYVEVSAVQGRGVVVLWPLNAMRRLR